MNSTLIALGHAMADGYSWGHAAKAADTAFQSAADLQKAAPIAGLAAFKEGLAQLLAPEGQGIKLFVKADEFMEQHEAFEDLREYLMDLCVLRLLTELEEEEEDAFDSPEWLKIEEAAADRGTELLNVLIYIKDCKLNDADPALDDFLYEFLLADEDDFQDELAIYEPFVKNMDLVEAPLKDLVLAGNHMRDNEMRELFTPMMLFFREAEAQPGKLTLALLANSAEPELHCALYRLLCAAQAGEL